jgi:hypothetical protein
MKNLLVCSELAFLKECTAVHVPKFEGRMVGELFISEEQILNE